MADDNPEPLYMGKHMIRIGYRTDSTSFRKIPRNRLVPQHINKVFHSDVEYLEDQFGTVLYPEEWIRKLAAKPYEYYIINKRVIEVEEDPLDDENFIGDTALFIENVPVEVNRKDLSLWVRSGLLSELDVIKEARKKVEDAEKTLMTINTKLEELPFLEVEETDPKLAAQKRKVAGQVLLEEKATWEGRTEKRKGHLKKLEKECDNVDVDLQVFERDPPTAKEQTWLCTLPPKHHVLTDKLVRKNDWPLFRLAIGKKATPGKDDAIPPMVVSGRLDEFPLIYEDFNLVQNMRLVRVSRRRHGHGARMFDHEDEVRITPNYTYRGGYKFGRRHGRGKCTTYHGILDGDWVDDCFEGEGSAILANGATYEGQVGAPKQSALISREYSMGTWHGTGTYYFPDGSRYEGEWCRGKPHGMGKYTQHDGEVMEGQFRDGMLHGQGKMKVRSTHFEGNWRRGLLIGGGKSRYSTGLGYEGPFEDGRESGFLRGDGDLGDGRAMRFYGRFRDGCREGVGQEGIYRRKDTMEISNAASKEAAKGDGGEDAVLESRYYGDFEGGKIRPRGIWARTVRGVFNAYYTFIGATISGKPNSYKDIHQRAFDEYKAREDWKITRNKEWRKNLRTNMSMQAKNRKSYARKVLEERVSFFDEDVFQLMTPEEQADELIRQAREKEKKESRELHVAMRRTERERIARLKRLA